MSSYFGRQMEYDHEVRPRSQPTQDNTYHQYHTHISHQHSYCQHCPGSYNNVAYSFGANYKEIGDIADINNWEENTILKLNYDADHFSVDPKREAFRMYSHVRSRLNNCLDVSDPTPQPTKMPTISPKPTPSTPAGTAVYDTALGAPKCSSLASFCDSGTLLNSRGSIGGMVEPNAPNTIDSCNDGSTGTYGSDESINSITVFTTPGIGGNLVSGATVTIEAKVNAYSAASDTGDFFYTSDVGTGNPNWVLIESVKPVTNGLSTCEC